MRVFGGIVIISLVFVCVLSQNDPTTTTTNSPPERRRKEFELGDMIPDMKLSFKQRHAGRSYSIQIQPDFLLRDDNFLLSLQLWHKPSGTNNEFTLTVESCRDPSSGLWSNKTWTMSSTLEEEVFGAKMINITLSEDTQLTDTSLDIIATIYTEAEGSCPRPLHTCECEWISPEDSEELREWEVIPVDLQLLLLEEQNKKNRHSSEEEESRTVRCISPDLVRNKRPNCQAGCNSDERPNHPGDSSEDLENEVDWGDVQFLLTIVMAGIFFILCPVCIVVFILYHRRMNAEASRIIIERQQRAVRRPRSSDVEVGVMVSPPDDIPPSYEDVHEIKTPPPSFEIAISRSPSPGPSSSSI